MKRKIGGALLASAACALALLPCARGDVLVLDDPLQGSTKGVRSGKVSFPSPVICGRWERKNPVCHYYISD